MQTSPSVRKTADSLTPAFAVVLFDLDNAPKPKRTAEPPKKKDKKADNPADATVTAAKDKGKAIASAVEGKNDATAPKETKEKKKDAGAVHGKKAAGSGKAAASAEDVGEPVPSMIDLRVGHIVDGQLGIALFLRLHIDPLVQSRSIQMQMASTLRCD